MTHSYNISGMTCNRCVEKAKNELLKMEDISKADVHLASPQAMITMQKHIPVHTLQSALQKAGSYTITEIHGPILYETAEEETKSWVETYKPVLLIFSYVSIIAIIAAASKNNFDWMLAMRIFMSGFFLAFSFFKMLEIKSFAESYSTYDIIAKKFISWGFVYPFIELLLGISYAFNFQPLLINAATFIVMSFSITGVLQSVLKKRKIKCACLGAVFNLPMSSITIIEDVLMIVMSGVMLIILL